MATFEPSTPSLPGLTFSGFPKTPMYLAKRMNVSESILSSPLHGVTSSSLGVTDPLFQGIQH